jgi:hypothetical protein
MVVVVVMDAGDQKVSYLLWLHGSAAEVSSVIGTPSSALPAGGANCESHLKTPWCRTPR